MVVLTVLILLATVFRGGNRGVALWVLECLALGVLLAAVVPVLRGQPAHPHGSPLRQVAWWALLLCPVWLPAIQWMAGSTAHTSATVYASLSSLPIMACLLAAERADDGQVVQLVKLWLGVALAQALFGLTQLSGAEALFFGMTSNEPVIGTYASKNTYANLLVMAIPLAVFQFFKAQSDRRGASTRHLWAWGLAVFVLVVTILLTTSRTGIATGLLTLLLSVMLLSSRSKGGRWGGIWRYVLALALVVVALLSGGLDWVERFDAARLAADDAARALTREATWQGALAFWPLGSGLGSYAWVFPRFQSPEVGQYWLDLAHNDYLQALMETGALGLLAMALALALVGRRALQLFRAGRGNWSSADRLAVACGLGLLATLLHAWVDYPLRIPANAMLAAFLLGVLLRETPVEPVAQ